MKLSRPCARNPKLGAQFNHVVSAATDAPTHDGSAAPEAVSPSFGRTLSQIRSEVLPRATVGTNSRALNCPGAGGHDTAIAVEPRNFDLTLRHEPGSQALRQGTDRSPVGSRSLHVWEHGGVDVSKVGKARPEVGRENDRYS
jgi:hypothetical protein